MIEKTKSNWLLGDHLGSTSMVANASGVVVSEARYSAFGEIWYDSGTMTTDYLYTGQRQEAEVGLYYYVARWYDPAIGRFIQADSIVPDPGSALGFDRYAYAYNSPLNLADPNGHIPEGACGFSSGDCGTFNITNSLTESSSSTSRPPKKTISNNPQSSGESNPFPSNSPQTQTNYSQWEMNILYELFWNGGQEGYESANYLVANSIHIKVGKPLHADDGYIQIGGDWQAETWVGAWYERNTVYLNPNSGYTETQLPNIWGISLVAHEAKHIEQGGFPIALTRGNEMEAWQLGIAIFQNLGGKLSTRDLEVQKAKTVQDFAYAIKHYDNTGYWGGLRFLPPWFYVP